MRKNVSGHGVLCASDFPVGYTPLLREWLARTVGDQACNEIFHPIAIRLLASCDAVLRGVGGPSTGRTKWRVLPGAWPTYPAEIPKVGSLRKHRCASLVLDPLFPVSLRLLKKAAPSLRNTTGQRSGFHAIGHIRRAARASRKLDPNATETSTPKVRELHSLVAGTGQKMRPDLISQPKK